MEALIDPQSTCASDWINSTITHDSNDTSVILHTIKAYGLLFGVSLVAFCLLRQWFPRVYNVRNCVEKYKTPLASDQRGWVSWMWKLFFVTETQLLDDCGMDALCFSRIFSFGIKLSAMGMFHALWLMPVYGTESLAPLIKDNDPIATVSITNLPSGSNRFIGTVVASYCIFSFVMYLMLQEFEWFTQTRHRFLTKLLPRNYTVYVQWVPNEFRNNKALLQFFQEGFAPNTVLSAHFALTVGNLKVLQKKRAKILDQLQVAIDHRSSSMDYEHGEESSADHPFEARSDSEIEILYQELEEMNRQVSICIDEVEQRAIVSGNPDNNQRSLESASSSHEGTFLLDQDENEIESASNTCHGEKVALAPKKVDSYLSLGENAHSYHSALDAVTDTLLDAATTVEEWSEQVMRDTGRAVLELVSSKDGCILPSAFVTFTSLRGTHTALQMVQYPAFYAMKVSEAPQPEDILWSNVGRARQELKMFSIVSLALTLVVCLLWTVPMAFISSIANLNGLRDQFHWLDQILTSHPRLEVFFNQLAPILILVAVQLMYLIAELFTVLEGPISGAIVQSRMFVKLYWFQITQTFFISAISGSVFAVLSDLIASPSCVVQLLASSLPGQSSFFIQLILVQTLMGMSSELLRPVPIALALFRSCIGPRSTERERRKTFLFMRPLADPVNFYQCNRLSATVLYFMVFFVYTTIAPISNFFIFICLLIQKCCVLHQLVYIYPPFPDSGGKLWLHFFRFVPLGMMISQITIIGMLSLKRASHASIAMTPLFIVTVLFWHSVRQEHFKLAELLSAKECNKADLQHAEEGVDWEFLQGKYVQPELRERFVSPENRAHYRVHNGES
ncbi:protein of unknown function DUF221-domain containing protein [Nitzschia inconspicua]|uniref:Uncharacterized protein n=1 Tax=Nitzschia inconspicua TaxID=303405 RepID=A0A9K3KRH3_9STRA|nr:protein of unknown function DUF221-domain containing protein [Nitzschia inconspicua]